MRNDDLAADNPWRWCPLEERIAVGGVPGKGLLLRAPTPIKKIPNSPHEKLPAHVRYYIERMKNHYPPAPLPGEERERSGKTKYIIHPGYVRSRTDGQMHWVGVIRLIRLYGLNMDECSHSGESISYGEMYQPQYIHLGPREDGDYRLPEKEEEDAT